MVMKYEVQLEKFEGPLDLLLQLIEKDKLDISSVSLAQVTQQYLNYIENNLEVDPEEVVDFLVIATKLLLLKSKILLPEIEDEEEESSLEQQLKIYKEFVDAAKVIKEKIDSNKYLFTNDVPPIKIKKVFTPPKDLVTDNLRELFNTVIQRLEPIFILPKSVMEKTISLHDKIGQIKNILSSRSKISFHTLIKAAESKTEVIVGFLAMLELVKQQEIMVKQEGAFGDIIIERKKEENNIDLI